MCLLFTAFAFMTAWPVLRAKASRAPTALWVAGFVYLAVAVLSIGLQLWFRRRIISEFEFEGRSLRFRTLGISSTEVRDVSEIARVRDWRGRNGMIGYRLAFRDGRKVYLERAVPNATAFADRLRSLITEP